LDLQILYFSLFGEKDKIKIVVFNFEGAELNHSSVCLEKGPVWMVAWRNVPENLQRRDLLASRKHVSEPSLLCHGTATSEFEEAASKQNLLSGRQNQVSKEMTVDVSIPMFDHCSKVCSTLTHGVFGPNASKPLCEW